ncbi:MAG: MarR family transcriptional regulator [Clostridiales bacterium]|nr:MarR family transcriptional regulator [Clostridiales bacterium]
MGQLEIGILIKQIHDKMRAYGDAALKQRGLTFSQMRVIQFVSGQGDRTTQKEIEDYLGVSHPTVVGLVTRLERNGFLYCYKDETNRRNKLVCNTRKACDMEREMFEEHQSAEEQLLRGLCEQERKELSRFLTVLNQNLDQRYG